MSVGILETNREKRRFSAQMKRFRKTNLLSREDVAELMGVHASTVKNIELCNHAPTRVVLLKFRDAKRAVKAGLRKSDWQLKRSPR